MNVIVEIFLTYAAVSMFSGIAYFFGGVVMKADLNYGVFLILWVGPIMLAGSIGGPWLLYQMWTDKF